MHMRRLQSLPQSTPSLELVPQKLPWLHCVPRLWMCALLLLQDAMRRRFLTSWHASLQPKALSARCRLRLTKWQSVISLRVQSAMERGLDARH
jgi:hypothetical protein